MYLSLEFAVSPLDILVIKAGAGTDLHQAAGVMHMLCCHVMSYYVTLRVVMGRDTDIISCVG